jgi:hypothetical protein
MISGDMAQDQSLVTVFLGHLKLPPEAVYVRLGRRMNEKKQKQWKK